VSTHWLKTSALRPLEATSSRSASSRSSFALSPVAGSKLQICFNRRISSKTCWMVTECPISLSRSTPSSSASA